MDRWIEKQDQKVTWILAQIPPGKIDFITEPRPISVQSIIGKVWTAEETPAGKTQL